MSKQLFLFSIYLFTSVFLSAQTPAGNNQEIQFNNNGVFGASPNLIWDGLNLKFLDIGTTSSKLYFRSGSGDDSYIFSENWGANKNRLVFHTRDDGDNDYAVFRNRHWNDGEKDVFEIHRTWTMANSNFYVMNGDLGIGTTSPSEKLEINGNVKLKELIKFEGSSNNFSGIKMTNDLRLFIGDVFNNDITTYVVGFGSDENAQSVIEVSDGEIFFKNEQITTMYMGANNVGIGTTTPDSKLTVAGNVHAQEVKVTVNAGADFVFNDDYKLLSLKEVEQYIKMNKHLPEIAPEKEMLDNGILLAEMNIKLLQKIEELTLYTIQQQQLLELQSKAIDKQSVAIKELQEKLKN